MDPYGQKSWDRGSNSIKTKRPKRAPEDTHEA